MDELIAQVSERTRLSAEDARAAAESVLGFLKDRLPDFIGSRIDGLISGDEGGGLGDIAKGFGGIFGGES
jgi:hypothetical protein